MSDVTYVVRPLSDRSWMTPESQRRQSRFGPDAESKRWRWWRDTMARLLYEIGELDGKNVVLGLDVEDRMLRLDGMLRADARPSTPAVEVAFDSTHGPMLYRCDRLTGSAPAYQHNVRAIMLTLEALRAVNRYGAVDHGEQYRGFRQIGAEPFLGEVHRMTGEKEAIDWLWSVVGPVDAHGKSTQQILKEARRRTHPDHGGDRDRWDRVQEAARILRLP